MWGWMGGVGTITRLNHRAFMVVPLSSQQLNELPTCITACSRNMFGMAPCSCAGGQFVLCNLLFVSGLLLVMWAAGLLGRALSSWALLACTCPHPHHTHPSTTWLLDASKCSLVPPCSQHVAPCVPCAMLVPSPCSCAKRRVWWMGVCRSSPSSSRCAR